MLVIEKEYKIIHIERLVGWFYVEANSEEEALEKWRLQVNNGEIDFSDMDIIDSEDVAVLNTKKENFNG